MQLLTALTEQLTALWRRWSVAQRVGISAAAALSVAVVAGTLFWATRAEYVVLVGQLTPQRAAEIVGVLETEQIASQLNFSGSAVSVPRADVSRARLALKDILDPVTAGEPSMLGGLMGSPAQEEDRRRRSQEQRLAASITQIRGVRKATVHLSLPEISPFVVEKSPATASIIVDLAPQGSFSAATAHSIVHMVSDAVEGLKPENVTLMDTTGRQFSARLGLASSMNEQLEYRQVLEAQLSRKAEALLTPILGRDKAIVQVAAEVDFRETTRIEQTLNPDVKVKRNETTELIEQTGGIKAPMGTVGAASNVLPDGLGDSAESASYKREMITADYETESTNETIRDLPGRVTRLTIAAVVDLSSIADPAAAAADAGGTAADTALPAVQLAEIKSTIENAVGYDAARGDVISVTVAPLQAPPEPEETLTPAMYWQQYESLIQNATLAFAAGLAFVIGVLLLRRMRPVVVGSAQDEPMSVADMRRLQSISEQAKAHPEVVASILAAWLEESAAADLPPTAAAATASAAAAPRSASRRAA